MLAQNSHERPCLRGKKLVLAHEYAVENVWQKMIQGTGRNVTPGSAIGRGPEAELIHNAHAKTRAHKMQHEVIVVDGCRDPVLKPSGPAVQTETWVAVIRVKDNVGKPLQILLCGHWRKGGSIAFAQDKQGARLEQDVEIALSGKNGQAGEAKISMRFPDTPGYCRVVLTLDAHMDVGVVREEAGYGRSSQDCHGQGGAKNYLALQMLIRRSR